MQKCRFVNWEDARYALAVHRHGSLARAAVALGVDATTVGRRVAALEGEIGFRLFDRRPEGHRLVPPARQLLPALEAMEAAARTIEARATGRDQVLEGTVRVSASEGFGARFLPERLAPFLRTHPLISVTLVTEIRSADVLRGEADLAVRLAVTRSRELIVRQVAELGYGLYAAPSLEDGKRAPLVGYEDRLADTPEARWLARWGQGRRVCLRASSHTAALGAARAGVGLAVLPCFLAEAGPGLVRLLGPDDVVRRPVCLVLHRDQRRTARTIALREHLVAVFAAERDALRG